jgi:hypothetical protein
MIALVSWDLDAPAIVSLSIGAQRSTESWAGPPSVFSVCPSAQFVAIIVSPAPHQLGAGSGCSPGAAMCPMAAGTAGRPRAA